MELTQLRYFAALAKNGNLTQTANELFITPPSLSVSISNLEKELGVSLFDRVGRRLYLNTYGLTFFNRIDPLLSSLAYAKAEVQDMEKTRDATVTIATTSPNVFQGAFFSFLKEHPEYKLSQTSLRLDQMDSDDLIHKYDFLLASSLDFVAPRELEFQTLYNNDYAILVLHPDHPYANCKEIALTQMRDESFVALSPGYSSRKFFDELCANAGFSPRVALECDYTMRFYMVMQKVGMTIATAHTKKLGYCGGAATIRIDPPFTLRVQNIYWNPIRYQSTASKAFLSYICEYFRNVSFEFD